MDFYKNFPDSAINLDESFEGILSELSEAGVTCMELLASAPIEVANRHHLNLNKVLRLLHFLKKEQVAQFEPQTKSLNDIHDEYISTGDAKLDDALGGGIYTRQLTEVFGESATGKSQFVMQLTRSVGSNAKSVLISTEGFTETKRLVEINPDLDGVLTINCTDMEVQDHIFTVQLPRLLASQNVRLVVIDSISHHLRVEFENDYKKLRQKLIEATLNLLNLSISYNFALVVVNQVSERPLKPILDTDYKKLNVDYQIGWLNGWKRSDILRQQSCDGTIGDEHQGNTKISTLGLNWEQFVDVKILLLKKYKVHEDYRDGNSKRVELSQELKDQNGPAAGYWVLKRYFKLVYSNRRIGSEKIEFKIDQEGISTT